MGIHNTSISEYESFFEKGLYNQTSMGKDTDELSNTVMYSDNFMSLMAYPNGDGEKRGETAIILKIPKKVFTHQQGIFETLPDGRYGIPTQFILGAFQNGEVVTNERYDKQYESDIAIKCEDRINMQDKELHAQTFRKVYASKRRKDKIINFIKRITGRKQKQLSLPEGEKSREDVTTFKEQLANEYGAPNLQEQKAFSEKIQRGNSSQQTYLSESEEEIE